MRVGRGSYGRKECEMNEAQILIGGFVVMCLMICGVVGLGVYLDRV